MYKLKIAPKSAEKVYLEAARCKLGASAKHYQEVVEKNCRYILSRNNHKALMCIERYNKRKEKQNYEQENKIGFIDTL